MNTTNNDIKEVSGQQQNQEAHKHSSENYLMLSPPDIFIGRRFCQLLGYPEELLFLERFSVISVIKHLLAGVAQLVRACGC